MCNSSDSGSRFGRTVRTDNALKLNKSQANGRAEPSLETPSLFQRPCKKESIFIQSPSAPLQASCPTGRTVFTGILNRIVFVYGWCSHSTSEHEKYYLAAVFKVKKIIFLWGIIPRKAGGGSICVSLGARLAPANLAFRNGQFERKSLCIYSQAPRFPGLDVKLADILYVINGNISSRQSAP